MNKIITSEELRKKFIKFFEKRGHKYIPSASLIPENDPSILFTTAGMHPLVPFLLGEPHPAGKRLVNIQKCLRTDDIEEVGDSTHNTFFEMMGYWSLGDYFKEESIRYTYDFFTQELNLSPEKIFVTVFRGDKEIPRDNESARIWQEKIGLKKEKIYFLPRQDNFWIAGDNGPCGPCTEVFYERDRIKKCGSDCRPGCSCGRYVEIGNNVFMEYNKIGKRYELLKQKNVDVGLGMERVLMVLQEKESIFETDLFLEIKESIEQLISSPELKNIRFIRIIADHLRAATFILAEKIQPSNLDRGYVLRRLIRRVIRYGKLIGIQEKFCSLIAQTVIDRYQKIYPELLKNKNFILEELDKEEKKFAAVIEKGMKEFEKQVKKTKGEISGELAFHLYDTYGFPLELTKELAQEKKIKFDEKGFKESFEKHRLISKKGASRKFKGGLADTSLETIKLHTAAHLLLASLRKVLGSHVYQRGSNITSERLRFDFSHPNKMTSEEIKKVEELVNQKIKDSLPVIFQEKNLEEAKKEGAMGVFENRYGERVKVYYIGNPQNPFSKEICGGPHVKNTKEIGKFKIIKEESSGAGVRRIKAVIY